MKSLLQSPPAALRQGNARTAVDHVVDDKVLAPVNHVVDVEFFVLVDFYSRLFVFCLQCVCVNVCIFREDVERYRNIIWSITANSDPVD
jgi:hypothetical protein